MTYEEARKFIKETEKLGSKPGLEAITRLLNRLGNPQEKLKIIHVAGTNGKGSTIAFLSAILAANGFRVGRYVSPSVFSYREKIQILHVDNPLTEHVKKEVNHMDEYELISDYISRDSVSRAVKKIKPICEQMVRDGYAHPTSFEIETAMTFLYMYWEQVDFLILESGMGGRLDATNVIGHPLCTIITSIGMDHMQYLGDNIEKIAVEKAGIIKMNVPIITCKQEPEAEKVLQNKAKELKSPFVIADLARVDKIRYEKDFTEFNYFYDDKVKEYRIHLLGKYQIQNAILALEAARIIHQSGYPLDMEKIRIGLLLAKWSGRFERISSLPDFFIDGAHNEKAAISLRDSIEIYFTNRRLIFMIGVLADKDYKSILRILAPLAHTIITLTPDNPRALASDRLAEEASVYCSRVLDGVNIRQALKMAYQEAGEDDVILAFGTLSFLGCLVNYYEELIHCLDLED